MTLSLGALMPETETLSRTLPGLPRSVAEARRVAEAFAGELPRIDDILMIVSELATNAVQHSRSRQDGGQFQIEFERTVKSLRVRVLDQGAASAAALSAESGDAFAAGENPQFPYGESGRGLVIVDALADDWGHEQHQDHAMWWAELWIKEA